MNPTEEKISEIFDCLRAGELTFSEAETAIIKIVENPEKEKPVEELPILVGHLNKEFGYQNCKPVVVGTEVFEFRERYFFYVENEKSGVKSEMKFQREVLKSCVDFL